MKSGEIKVIRTTDLSDINTDAVKVLDMEGEIQEGAIICIEPVVGRPWYGRVNSIEHITEHS